MTHQNYRTIFFIIIWQLLRTVSPGLLCTIWHTLFEMFFKINNTHNSFKFISLPFSVSVCLCVHQSVKVFIHVLFLVSHAFKLRATCFCEIVQSTINTNLFENIFSFNLSKTWHKAFWVKWFKESGRIRRRFGRNVGK